MVPTNIQITNQIRTVIINLMNTKQIKQFNTIHCKLSRRRRSNLIDIIYYSTRLCDLVAPPVLFFLFFIFIFFIQESTRIQEKYTQV